LLITVETLVVLGRAETLVGVRLGPDVELVPDYGPSRSAANGQVWEASAVRVTFAAAD